MYSGSEPFSKNFWFPQEHIQAFINAMNVKKNWQYLVNDTALLAASDCGINSWQLLYTSRIPTYVGRG